MSANFSTKTAKKIVDFLKNLPNDRIQHYVDFKELQIQRFEKIAGIQSSVLKDKKFEDGLSLSDVKDMLTRTKSPLGLQKSVLKKFAEAVPQETWNDTLLNQQLASLKTISNDKYKKMYDVSDKLYQPHGNPQYYQRLLDEITGKSKENFFTAMKTVITGK